MPANLENSAVARGQEKISFIPIPEKGNAKELSNYHTIALISHASKVMPQILKDRLQQYINRELPDVQTGFGKGRGTRNQKLRNSKTTSASLTMLKPLTVWITTNCGIFLKRWEYRPPYLPPEKSVCRSSNNS